MRHAICETVFYLYPAGWPVTRDGAVTRLVVVHYRSPGSFFGPGRKGEDPARRRAFVVERLFDPSKALFPVFEG